MVKLLLTVVLIMFLWASCYGDTVEIDHKPQMPQEEKVEMIAERLRQEYWQALLNNCVTKSARFKKSCKAIDIETRVVICFGVVEEEWFDQCLTVPKIHAWGEVNGERIEVTRPLGTLGIWGADPRDIRPILAIRL